ncbi:hypothetical protein ACC771_14835, partial [Rhizobium ruizarguesonis]
RMACLSTESDLERRARKAAFIIAYAARQVPLIDIARKGIERLGGDVLLDLPDIAAIPSWSSRILFLVGQLLAVVPEADIVAAVIDLSPAHPRIDRLL